MKKIKKWHFILFIIIIYALLNGIKLLVERPWIFEKKIPINEYENYLENTVWRWDYLETKWIFDKNGNYKEFIIQENNDNKYFFEGSWQINENKLIIDGVRYIEERSLNENTIKNIKMLTKNYLITNTLSPSTGGYSKTAKLKRLNNE